jgi:hypothetical protein
MMAKKAPRGVRPEEMVAALDRFFGEFLSAAEQQSRALGGGATLYAAQVVFWDKLDMSLWLDDQVALQLTFTDGQRTPFLSGDHLAYVLTQDNTVASVAADEGSLGHITVLVGRLVRPYLAGHPLVLSRGPLKARGIAAWDLRRVLAEAIVLVPEARRALIDLEADLEEEREEAMRKREKRERKKREKEKDKEAQESEEETRKRRRRALARLKRWQRKTLERENQRREGIAIPESRAGRELLNLLQPTRAWRALYDRLGTGREEWLANALAEIILDRSLDGQVAALLPMEYLNVEGQGIMLSDVWLAEKRSAADVIKDRARADLEAEALGRGFGSRRSKRKVVPVSDLGEGEVDLGELSPAAQTSSPLDEVETRLDLQRALPQLTPAEGEALSLQLEAQKERRTLEEVCQRHGVRYGSTRKNLERARRHLKSILDQ